MGDRLAALSSATRMLGAELGPVRVTSSVYLTAPVGLATQEFLNAALILESPLPPLEAMRALLRVEARHGRTRDIPGGDRTLDCDLILCQTATGKMLVSEGVELCLPHPRALERDFVLVPAAEIAPAWRHPLSGLTLHDECVGRGFHLIPHGASLP